MEHLFTLMNAYVITEVYMLKHTTKKCQYCGRLISSHRKCKMCEILLHEKNNKYVSESSGIQYTLESPRVNYCMKCFESNITLIEKLEREKNK